MERKRAHAPWLAIGVIVLGALLAFKTYTPTTTEAATSNTGYLSGYAWSGGAATADSGIGWIQMYDVSGQTYGVCLTNDQTTLTGYAWSSNVGWISFNQAHLTGCPSGTCSARLVNGALQGWARACAGTGGGGVPKTVVLTSGTSWVVPSDWNPNDNSIEVIGAGGGGGPGGSGFNGYLGNGGVGGAGGGYANASLSLTPGATLSYRIGSGGGSGIWQQGGGTTGGVGGDTYFNGTSCNTSSVCAHGGAGGVAGSPPTNQGWTNPAQSNANITQGGTVAVGTGYSGGNGGLDGANWAGGGGGGAAGPNGAGNSANTGTPGSGDAGSGGAAGSNGPGGNGTEWSSSPAYGSGGGGAVTQAFSGAGNRGGNYGAGGSGGAGGANSSCDPWCQAGGNGGAGAPGIIVIKYTSLPAAGDCSVPTARPDWDGWISLSGASPTYGPVSSSGSNGVNGTFSGYAWGSDIFGWINFGPDNGFGGVSFVNGPATTGETDVSSFSASPARVKEGGTVTINYTLAVPAVPACGNAVIAACTIAGTNGFSAGPFTTSGSIPTVGYPITEPTKFTITCDGIVKKEITVTPLPRFQEI